MSGIPLSMMRPVVGGSKGSRGDYREVSKLIDGLSSDSEQEQFSLPPLDLRNPASRSKRFKEKVSNPGESKDGCCSMKVAFFTLVLLILCVVVAGLAVYTYSMNKDLQAMKAKMGAVESGSASNPDEFQELHRKQEELEDSVSKIISGKNGIQSHETNISSIFQQLKVLDQTTKALSKSVDAAPQLEELPGRVDQLSQQTAEFGSKIATLQQSIEALDTFQTNTEAALADLQASKGENDALPRESLDIPAAIVQIREDITSLGFKLDTLNMTANRKYLEVKEHMDKHARDLQRLNTSVMNIEGQLQSLPTAMPGEVAETASQVQELISSSVEQLRQTMATKDELQILQNEVRNVSSSLQLLSNQLNSLTGTSSEVTSADLDKLRGDLDQCCARCTETMKNFNSSLADLRDQISSQQPAGATDQDATGGAKVAARDLYKVRRREGEEDRQHRAEASELLKKAIQESGDH